MGDLTVHAEALIATAVRAFYDDTVIAIVDVLIRDKFLREDDMTKRLQLSSKLLRQTLEYLKNEHLVNVQAVDDLEEGGSQTTPYYYLDYNRAVHSIRLRIHLLRKQLQEDEIKARSNSYYICPGYTKKRCNGKYTEEDAQRMVDTQTGLFLCLECVALFENDPKAVPRDEYTLQLIDNEQDLKLAVDRLRRLNTQLSAKAIGNHQLRPGLYDLLKKVKGEKGSPPITSNLPWENKYFHRGSTRIEGTGRTMAMKVSKMQKEGIAQSAAQAREFLVGGGRRAMTGGDAGDSTNDDTTTSLLFLKSAHGHEIRLLVERGAGSRAQVLARKNLETRKLMDAAAARVAASLPIPLRVQEHWKRKAAAEAEAEAEAAAADEEEDEVENDDHKNTGAKRKKIKRKVPAVPDFLVDNIGRLAHERSFSDGVYGTTTTTNDSGNGGTTTTDRTINGSGTNGTNGGKHNNHEPELVWSDDLEEWAQLPEETRIATFQAQYKAEMARQEKILQLKSEATSPRPLDVSSSSTEEEVWEDGDVD
jgi:transcription initiation factor TFIIE subunit alpha